MRYLIFSVLSLLSSLVLTGCQSLFPENPFERPVFFYSAAQAEAEAEVQQLFEQKYIDPLTRYIENNKFDDNKTPYVEQVRVERERRCDVIAGRYDRRAKTSKNLARLRAGYQYSCPDIVTAFAKQVPVSRPAPRKPTPVAKAEQPKIEKPVATQPVQPAADAGQLAPVTTDAATTDAVSNEEMTDKVANSDETVTEPLPEESQLVPPPAVDMQKQTAACTSAFYAESNYAKALELCELPAQENNPKAQYALGFLYEKGRVVTQDDSKALEWYQKAASNGFAKAQFMLGRRYYTGEGVGKDYTKAAAWQRQAANQNHVEAQYILAVMYELGQGVPQDFVSAYQWSLLAAAQGHSAAVSLRDELGSKLSPWEKSEGQRLAREWFEKRNGSSPIT